MAELKIGSTIYRFDDNRRVYEKDDQGKTKGGPIYAKKWRPVTIEGETSRSWLVQYYGPEKAPKTGPHAGWAFSEKERDDDIWVNDKSYKISTAVSRCRDAQKLRAIAEILGVD